MEEYVILMADIVGSRKLDQGLLMKDFKRLVEDTNEALKKRLVSPLTITLGDEFQGVMNKVEDALAVIWELEELMVEQGVSFKLRYVVVEGLIETPVNKEIAYGMLGDGLTRARNYLTEIKKEDSRFFFWLKDQEKKKALNNLFLAVQDLLNGWLPKEYFLVDAFLKTDNYRKVAEKLKKEPSLMWKRKRSLQINTYLGLKETANYIAYV